MKKRVLSMLLVIAMVIGIVPAIPMEIKAAVTYYSNARWVNDDTSIGKKKHKIELTFSTSSEVSGLASGGNCDNSHVELLFRDDINDWSDNGHASTAEVSGSSYNKYLGGNFMKNKGDKVVATFYSYSLPTAIDMYVAVELYSYGIAYSIKVNDRDWRSGNLSAKNGWSGAHDLTSDLSISSAKVAPSVTTTTATVGGVNIPFSVYAYADVYGETIDLYHSYKFKHDGDNQFYNVHGIVLSDELVQMNSDSAFNFDGIKLENGKIVIDSAKVNAANQTLQFRVKSTVAMGLNDRECYYGSPKAGYSPVITVKPQEITATLDRQGGTGGSASTTAIYSHHFNDITPPQRTGYTFGGYYTGTNGSGTKYINANGTSARTCALSGNSTLCAYWIPNTYAITLDENGGEAVADVTATYDSSTNSQVAVPVRTGYTFNGWYTQQSSGEQVYDNTGKWVSGNYWSTSGTWKHAGAVTLFAQWTANEYTLTYDSTGGTKVSDQTVTFDAPYLAPARDPKRVGFTLDGWYLDSALTEAKRVAFGSTVVKTPDHHTVYAKWNPIRYTINYLDGKNTLDYEERSYNEEFTLKQADADLGMAKPYRKHFVGWTTVSGGSNMVMYADGQLITSGLTSIDGGEVNLYAVWADDETYRVVYDPNGGSGGPKDGTAYYEDDSVTVKFDTLPERPGYQFRGWAESADAAAAKYAQSGTTSFAMGEENVTLYAVWKPITYTLKYNTGVSTVIADQECTYDVNVLINNGSTLSRENYTFKGWAINQGSDVVTYAPGEKVLNLTNEHEAEISLYAVWQENPKHRVYYDANGGTGAPTDTAEYYLGNSVPLSADKPALPGYTFVGWNTDSKATVALSSLTMGESAVILYAVWTPNTYTIKYNANGTDVSGSIADQTCTYDTVAVLNNGSALSRTGYTFQGWALSANGNVAYAGGVTVLNLHNQANAEFDLYAVWKPDAVVVTFDGNGGTPAVSNYSYSYGEPYGILPNATREGYSFKDWFTQAMDGTAVSITDIVKNAVTLYAQWIAAQVNYTVHHYKQNRDFSYYVTETEVLYGYTGDQTAAAARACTAGTDYEGYTAQPITQQTIKADGTTVVEVYYNMDAFSVYGVEFDGNGADVTGTAPTDADEYMVEDVIELPENGSSNFKKPGYVFVGWNTNAQATFGYNGKYTVTTADTDGLNADNGDKITFYAIWKAADDVAYTVEHYRQKGDLSDYELFETETKAGTTGTVVEALPKFYDGFTINEAAADAVPGGTVAADGSLVLKLYYDRNSYTVSFVPNGGTATGNLSSYIYGMGAILPSATREGYAFEGWYEAADLSGNKVEEISGTEMGDKTYYAKWTQDTYAVAFAANDGASGTAPVDTGRYALGGVIVLPANGTGNFSKAGHSFIGWNTDKEATYGYNNEYTVTSADINGLSVGGTITFYAIWKAADDVAYTVEHYRQKGDLSGYELFETETKAGTTGTVVEALPKFYDGFTINEAAADAVPGGTVAADGSLVLKLYYDRNSYTVSFVPNGGTVLDSLTSYVYGVGADLPDAEKTGYTFEGWFESPDLSGTKVETIPGTEKGDKTYYARWTENTQTTYKVMHYQQDLYGGYTKKDEDSFFGKTGEYTAALTKAYTGFTAQPVENVKIDGDGSTVVTIKYDRNSYQLVFDANGGMGGTSEQMLYETPIREPDVTRPGWTFTGWTPAVAASMPAQDTIYTANWTQDSYVIAYDANGGSGSLTQTPFISDTPTLSDGTGFARDGWTLIGWSTASGDGNAVNYALGQTLGIAPVGKDQTFRLYAVWQQNLVQVTFDANGGEVSPTTMLYPENGQYQNMPIPMRADYTFAGWFDKATDDGNRIAGGATLISDDPHTLYAHWATDTYSVVYHANGGAEADKTVSYPLSGTPTLEGNIFTRANYDHIGWATAPNGAVVYQLGAALGANLATTGETVDLYAVWGISDVVGTGYSGVYDGMDHDIFYSLAQQITVTQYQWYFKPAGTNVYIPVADTDNDPMTYPVRDVAQSGTYYCHVDGLEDAYYVISFDTEEMSVAITPRPITVTASDGEKVYDGTPLTQPAYTFTLNETDKGLCIGHTAVAAMTADSTITNVGQTPNTVGTVAIFDAEYRDVTVNYAITTQPGTLKVTPRSVKLAAAENTLNMLYGTSYADAVSLLLSRYSVDPATPLGAGDTMDDLFIGFEYSTDGGVTFTTLTEAALNARYQAETDFVVRPLISSTNYTLADSQAITVSVVKTTLWAKTRWYGSYSYTNSLTLTFYRASYDAAADKWVVDESAPVVLPNGVLPNFEIRNYSTGEVICSGQMTLSNNNYLARFNPIYVQAQVFFSVDGYVILSN